MALCMFWKSEATDIQSSSQSEMGKSIRIVHFKNKLCVTHTLWPDTLGGPAWARAQLSHLASSRVVSSPVLSLGDGCHEVARGGRRLVGIDDGVGDRAHAGHPLHVLVGQVCLALLFALGQSHVQRLGGHDASVHLCHGFGGLLRGGEADETKAFAAAAFQHDLRVTGLNQSINPALAQL